MSDHTNMSMSEYLADLEKHLHTLPKEERSEALRFFEEYLHDQYEPAAATADAAAAAADAAAAATDAAATAAKAGITGSSLPTPKEAAARIKAELALNEADARPGIRRLAKGVWLTFLAVVAAPLAGALAITAAALVFSLLLVCALLSLSCALVAVSLVLAGIVEMVIGAYLVPQDFPAAIFDFGLGLVCLGIGVFSGIASLALSRNALRGVANLARRLLSRIKREARTAAIHLSKGQGGIA
ncbi:MAG: hypothetical protein LBD25_05945 [Coriobacteriales bacterium]|jgi:uncharacterized membrane protein|nr:hypothetical protein [Coriobacteriales bacterium]